MNPTLAPCRIAILLVVVTCVAWFADGSLYQRRVCPTIELRKEFIPGRYCKRLKKKDLCTSDAECTKGGERCCPTECFLKCQKTVTPTGCPIPIDLALLLDSSGSIGRRNWKKVQKFAKDVVDIYDISEKGTHIAILAYSSKPVIEIKFNKYTGSKLNGVSIKRDIDKFRLQKGLTFIDKALELANNELFTKEAGMRDNVRKVALVLTDGIQTKNKGPYTDLLIASEPLKAKGIDVYSLGVGSDIDVLELIQTATNPDFVFSASNFDDLNKKVTEITDAQCKACDRVVDVVFGIPDSTTIPKSMFDEIKGFFVKLSSLFKISPAGAHYGIVRYSDSAEMVAKLDTYYNLNQIQQFIKSMKQQGSGVDVNQAILSAADQAFTMFGGVRQPVPKTFVIFIPQKETVDKNLIRAATEKLKSMGVRIMFVGLDRKSIDVEHYASISSQPSGRYLLKGFDIEELTEVASYEAVDTICKARYGKCPLIPPKAQCPPGKPKLDCNIDSECPSDDNMCCYDECGESTCTTTVRNCFITMDVALAIDSSSGVNDDDFKKVKDFAKNLVHNFASSENNIHFGLVQYAGTAETKLDFNKLASDSKIKETIDGLSKSSDGTRRVDIALQTIKKDVFSLEGGMRQGHPRYAIFITAGDTDPSSESVAKASEALRGLGVNVIAVGINSGVSKGFLNSLATDPKLVFSLDGADGLATTRPAIETEMCREKPGKCPPSKVTVPSFGCYYDEGDPSIPCGVTAGKMPGKSNDWDCPGEQKCCMGADGCAICTDPPNECRGQYDLTLVMENSASISPQNFKKMKSFAKELVSAFFISDLGTRVASVSYGDSALVNFKLNTIPGVNRKIVYSEIDKLSYGGGAGGGVSSALEEAVKSIYTEEGGTRALNNKSLVIMGTGKFVKAKRASLMANRLRQEQVDVFFVPIGGEGDVAGVRKVVSKKVESNAFMTTSFNALRPHLRALTKAVCDGAEKLKPCKVPVDVVFGIPTSGSLGGQFGEIKKVFTDLLNFFVVNNRLAHFGIIQYSNDAAMTVKIDSVYNKDLITKYISNIRASGNKFNVEAAFRRASDHAFTIFGGVRQTVPKTFVIFVPREASTDIQNVLAAAQNLKRMGVKVVVLGLGEVPQLNEYRQLAASQPSSKFFFGDTMDDIIGSIYDIKETICKGRYGRCPPEPTDKCTSVAESCQLDMDCGDQSQMCCAEPGCQRSCTTKLNNCFVNMEIALAIDNSQDGAGGELNQVKQFVSTLIRPLATSENSMRLSLMTFGTEPKTLAKFRDLNPERVIQQKIAAITSSGVPGRDLNNAFQAMRNEHYSLEGGMRQGHPRLAIFVVGGDAPDNFADAANELKSLDGMRVIAIGTKQSVSNGLLAAIASESSLVFKANSAANLNGLLDQIRKKFCQPKPGKCPPAPVSATGCPTTVPSRYIPCKNSDWPCPGEQKCCRDPTGCFGICREAPRECRGVFDLAILLESNDAVGRAGFNRVKTFAKQLIDGFSIDDSGTRVAVISYGDKAKVDFKFNTITNSNKRRVKARIDRIPYRGGGPSLTSQALQEAFQQVYKFDAGSRGPGVNKSLLIISQGKYQDPGKASRYASQLQQQRVDVYQIAIGGNEDISAIRGVASKKQHKTVFITSSYDALKPHLRAVTDRICEGADKPYICKKPIDLIFGIPVAKELGGSLGSIKTFLTSFTKRFVIGNRGTHIGMIPYSNRAVLDKPIDAMYNEKEINDYINGLTHRGNGFNLTKALKVAADYGFNIYGGTRPTAPKTFVLIVPDGISPGDESAVIAASRKLKSIGVRLVILGIRGGPKRRILRRMSSQPSRKYLIYGNYDDFIASTERLSRTICRGLYGTCNERPPPPPDCPDPPITLCEDDDDCGDPNQRCCETECAGSTKCTVNTRNCFINMDIALAIDTSDGANLPAIKDFAKKFVTSIADAENANHFSVMSYDETPTTKSTFGELLSKQQTHGIIDGLTAGTGQPRVDLALAELENAHFSLEGRTRKGLPRYAFFITSKQNSPSSGDIGISIQALQDMDVNIAAVGTNSALDALVDSLATNSSWAFKAASPADLPGLVTTMKNSLCPKKPGKCPPVAAVCASPGLKVPLEFIPCGESAGKAGRSDKENDWDCPGEQRCCKDPTGCHQICRDTPNECPGTHDLTFLVDSSNEVGEENFELAKKFVNNIVDAFKIGMLDTQVALISYGATTKVDMTFNMCSRAKKERIKGAISRVRFIGNGPSSTATALQQAVDVVYSEANGAREGVNKSLVIISPGKFTNPAGAIRLAGLLKLNQVDVFAVPIGKNPDIATIKKVVSKKPIDTTMMTTNYLALRPHVRALTKAICDGAEKIKICDRRMDVVFGIPTAIELGDDIQKVKEFYKNVLQLFKVNNRKVHIGLIPYSSSARLSLNLDKDYSRESLIKQVENLQLSGSGYNVRDALRVAADHAFTMFGGTRPTAPKTFVLFVPGTVSGNTDEIQAAATKLKSVGVHLMVMSLKDKNSYDLFSNATSQPAQKHYRYGDYDLIGSSVYDVVDNICKAKYGKCPAYPEPEVNCSADDIDECSLDEDCLGPEEVCCTGSCGKRVCNARVKNCFVAMDMAIAVDASSTIPDAEFAGVKKFLTQIVHASANSENNIHYGLLKYGMRPQLMASFRQFESEAKFKKMIADMAKTADTDRRLDLALRGIKNDIFSLTGGMRQGRPRYAVMVVSGPNSAESGDLVEASRLLRALGVKIFAVGSNGNVDNALLEQIASDPKLVFKAANANDFNVIWNDMQNKMCSPKPGICPPVAATCSSPGDDLPLQFIPCGASDGKKGRSDKENDWDCPGTTRCCKDPTGCHSICREPPNACNGQHDLTILMDNSANSGREGFEKIKQFSQQLVDAFDISSAETRVAVISYDDKANVNFRFNSPGLSSKGAIKNAIQQVPYLGGAKAELSKGLKLALDKVYTLKNGMRRSSNKSLVIIGSGKFANPSRAARFAGELKLNLVDVFVMPIGYDPDIPAVKQIASPVIDNNVFMTTSPEALRPHLRSLTKRICEGAEKPKVCETPMDIVYGIPTAASLWDGLEEIKSFFKSMTRQFRVSNRQIHIGLIPYSDSARLALNIDSQYSPNGILNAIENIKKEGSGLNVARAIQVAADHAFTIYGGTRPTAPKTFVLFVPGPGVGTTDAIRAAAAKLKSVGVKLMVVGLKGVDSDLYKLAASQPHQRYFLNGNYDDVHAKIPGAVDTICKGRYGKCPAYKPETGDCGPSTSHECDVDGDCSDQNHACCEGNCGRKCLTRVKNCFTAMDIAIAMDATSSISDQVFESQKRIATHIVNSIADAENSIHYGLLRYGATSQVLADFNRMASDAAIKQAIKNMRKTGDPERRIDTALAALSTGIFSLEGGMRQGHPRHVIFFTSGSTATGSDDLVKSAKGLRDLGVRITAIGVGGAEESFLRQLAGDGGTAIKVSPAEVDTVWSRIQESLCPPKPELCPPVSQSCTSPGSEVPLEYIPCGKSAGKSGRSQKQNDWDCPGEDKCCLDPSGCFSICRPSPNYCPNLAHDLAILIERSDATGLHGWEKAKAFAQDLADAFYIAERGTHVAVATYGPTAEVQYRFNRFQGPQLTNANIRNSIGKIQYAGGSTASASGALNLAVNDIFTDRSGAREGVNKSLVIIGSGQFLDSARAISLSASLKQNLVDVFSVPVGPNYDIATQRKFVSPNANKNVFVTTSHDALRPHLRAVTKAICDGAIKIRKCKRPVDVYFGIPNAKFLAPQFANIRKSFVNLLRQLVVSNRLIHAGIMQYSDSAGVLVNLDRTYNRDALENVISRELGLYGSGLNLAELLNKAADHGFTIYGGTRQTAPKVLVIFIPGPVSSSPEDIKKAADKLKGLGVRLVILGLNNAIDKPFYSTIVTQPASKFLLTADTYDGLSLALSAAANRICNAKYGRCPKPPEAPPSCPDNVEDECSQDRDCKKLGDLCCKGGCTRTCQKGIKNCFVPMDIAFALDVSETTTSDQLASMKEFVRETMRSFANSENDIHFSLMQYAGTPIHLTPGFRLYPSEVELVEVLNNVRNINDPTRRVDLAISSAKRNIFSPEGRMRQGHPRYLIFLTSSATSIDSADLNQARKPLDAIDVKTIAVGTNKDVDPLYLQQLATENSLVYQAQTPDEFATIRNEMAALFCDSKKGKCVAPAIPPDPAVCASQPEVPLQYIPCGNSVKGKEGRSQRENDWDCPGESKCCLDSDTGCHNVCVYPPIVCTKPKDLELVVESSQFTGQGNFARIKKFLQYFVEAFGVGRDGTQIGMITYGTRSRESFRLNAYRDTKGVQEGIRNSRFMGGFPYPSDALVTALDISFTRRSGARQNANKSLVLFTSGKFEKPDRAASVAFQLKEKLVDVYAVAIGDNPEVDNLRNVVSRPIEKNIFMVSSPDALRAQARALVKRVCDGAEKNYVVCNCYPYFY